MTEYLVTPPDECINCQWKPVIIETGDNNQKLGIEDGWVMIPIPNTVAVLFVCPKCGAVMANKNIKANVKQLLKEREQRILRPQSQSPNKRILM